MADPCSQERPDRSRGCTLVLPSLKSGKRPTRTKLFGDDLRRLTRVEGRSCCLLRGLGGFLLLSTRKGLGPPSGGLGIVGDVINIGIAIGIIIFVKGVGGGGLLLFYWKGIFRSP